MLVFCFLESFLSGAEPQIMHLVSIPRAMSTATFRLIEEQENFVGFHEPTLAVYNTLHNPIPTKGYYHERRYRSYDEIVEAIENASKDQNVIIKDVAFTMNDFLMDAQSFIQKENVHYIFLVRNPYDTITSLYKIHKKVHKKFSYLVAMDKLYSVFQKVRELNPNKIHIFRAKEIVSNPLVFLQSVCRDLSIEINRPKLFWDSFEKNNVQKLIDRWSDQKVASFFYRMHKNAIEKTHIGALSSCKIPDNEEEWFKEIAEGEEREKLVQVYLYHLDFYNRLLSKSSIICRE